MPNASAESVRAPNSNVCGTVTGGDANSVRLDTANLGAEANNDCTLAAFGCTGAAFVVIERRPARHCGVNTDCADAACADVMLIPGVNVIDSDVGACDSTCRGRACTDPAASDARALHLCRPLMLRTVCDSLEYKIPTHYFVFSTVNFKKARAARCLGASVV